LFKNFIQPSDQGIRTQFRPARQSSEWLMRGVDATRYDAGAAFPPFSLPRAPPARTIE
jgi:hypothetical protein